MNQTVTKTDFVQYWERLNVALTGMKATWADDREADHAFRHESTDPAWAARMIVERRAHGRGLLEAVNDRLLVR